MDKKNTNSPKKVETTSKRKAKSNLNKGTDSYDKQGSVYAYMYEREVTDLKRLNKWHKENDKSKKNLDGDVNEVGSQLDKASAELPEEASTTQVKTNDKEIPKIVGFKRTDSGVVPVKKEK